jgi:hypothetical protein
MQMLGVFENSVSVPVLSPCESAADAEFGAIQMRALRRKARRISAYARFNVDALNALAGEVEIDIAGLQH